MALKVGGSEANAIPGLGVGPRLVWNSNAAHDAAPVQPEAEDLSAEGFGDSDRLFAGLDGRAVAVRGRRWRIEVYSAWDQADRRWVQLALRGQEGEPDFMLTLRLAATDGVRHAVLTLSSWLANPTKARTVLNVA
jgi:hypothetical protein